MAGENHGPFGKEEFRFVVWAVSRMAGRAGSGGGLQLVGEGPPGTGGEGHVGAVRVGAVADRDGGPGRRRVAVADSVGADASPVHCA